LCEIFRGDGDIDKARTRNLNLASNASQMQLLDYFLRECTWVHSAHFGSRHHAICLIVTKFGTDCRLNIGGSIDAARSRERGVYTTIEKSY
jgi:hypothetical protein